MGTTRTLGTIKQNHSVIIEQGLQELANTLDKGIQKMNALVSYESVIEEIYEGTRQPKRVTEVYCNDEEFAYEIEIITGKVINVGGDVRYDSDGLYCDITQILNEEACGDDIVLPEHLVECLRGLITPKVDEKVGKDLEIEYYDALSESQEADYWCDLCHARKDDRL
jgi:hypothetical protein